MGIGKIQYRKTYNFTHGTYSRPHLVFEASAKKARNGPSTHVIDAASFVKLLHCTMKAGELS